MAIKYIDAIWKIPSLEPLGQFEQNLGTSIIQWRGFKFVQTKGIVLYQGEIIAKLQKYIDDI